MDNILNLENSSILKEKDFTIEFSQAMKLYREFSYQQASQYLEECLNLTQDSVKRIQIYIYLSICQAKLGSNQSCLLSLSQASEICDNCLKDTIFSNKQLILQYKSKIVFNKVIQNLICGNLNQAKFTFEILSSLVTGEENLEIRISLIREVFKILFQSGIWRIDIKKEILDIFDDTKKQLQSQILDSVQKNLEVILKIINDNDSIGIFIQYLNLNIYRNNESLMKYFNSQTVIDNMIKNTQMDTMKYELADILELNSKKIRKIVEIEAEDCLCEYFKRIVIVKEIFKRFEKFVSLKLNKSISPSIIRTDKLKFISSPEKIMLPKGTNTPGNRRISNLIQLPRIDENKMKQTKKGNSKFVINKISESLKLDKTKEEGFKSKLSPPQLFYQNPINRQLTEDSDNENKSYENRKFSLNPNQKNPLTHFDSRRSSEIITLKSPQLKRNSLQIKDNALLTKFNFIENETVKLVKFFNPPNTTKQLLDYQNFDIQRLNEDLIGMYKENLKSQRILDLNIQNFVKASFSKSLAGVNEINEKKENQDICFEINNFLQIENLQLYCVCDGHGDNGKIVSKQISETLAANIHLIEASNLIRDKSSQFQKKNQKILHSSAQIKEFYENNFINLSLVKANKREFLSNIRDGFMKTNEDLEKSKDYDYSNSGATCCCVIIHGQKVYCANVGDSRAVIGRITNDNIKSICLSNDHKPSRIDEKSRVINSNGRVEPYKSVDDQCIGPDRVWLKDKNFPGLAMTRSIGDLIAKKIGVTSEPEIHEFTLSKGDKFIIIASDGLWEFISNENAVEIVANCLDPENAADELISAAKKEWKRNEGNVDDITVIIVFLKL